MSVDRQTRHVRLGWVCSAFDRFGRVLLRDITVVDVSGTSSSTGVLFGVEAQAVRSLLTARRRTLAVGIGVSGIGLGTLLVAPLAAELIARYGWRNAYLVLAAVSTVALAGCGLLVRAAPTATTDAEAAPLLDRLARRRTCVSTGAGCCSRSCCSSLSCTCRRTP